MKTVEVAAGLVFRDGRLLITQRPAGGHLAGLWEFPGGKRDAGETFEECLQRELREELGIDVRVGELIETIDHQYPEKHVRLQFHRCTWLRHEPQPLQCAAFAWIQPEELHQYDFPAADAHLLARLRADLNLWADP